MLATAAVVYYRVGLSFLRRGWINLDLFVGRLTGGCGSGYADVGVGKLKAPRRIARSH